MVWFKNIKNIHGLVNIVKDWKKTFIVDRMTQYMLTKAFIYIEVPRQRWILLL